MAEKFQHGIETRFRELGHCDALNLAREKMHACFPEWTRGFTRQAPYEVKIPLAAQIALSYLHFTMNAQAKALRLQINHLRAELETCTTKAMRRCVTESIQAAEKQLTELGTH